MAPHGIASPDEPDPPPIQDLSYRLRDGEEISYALFVPSSYHPARPAPLVVLLHGLYSTPSQVIRYEGITAEAERRGFLVVAPYGYNTYGWYGSLGPGNDFAKRYRLRLLQWQTPPEDLGQRSEDDVLHVLALVRRSYAIDPARIYLMGHSMGGGGAFHLALKYPDLWAGIAALAPAVYSNPAALAKIRHLPVIVVQGDADRLVSIDTTRRWVRTMNELGMSYRYIEIPRGDHILSIVRNAPMIHQVFDFFDAHARRLRPRSAARLPARHSVPQGARTARRSVLARASCAARSRPVSRWSEGALLASAFRDRNGCDPATGFSGDVDQQRNGQQSEGARKGRDTVLTGTHRPGRQVHVSRNAHGGCRRGPLTSTSPDPRIRTQPDRPR